MLQNRETHPVSNRKNGRGAPLTPDGLIRTVQRVKIWRAATAHELVFGPFANARGDAEVAQPVP